MRVAQQLEPFNIAWLEEPVMFDNVDTLAELARKMNVPISAGEQLYNRWEFRPLLEKNAVHIIQPDICHAGGISELKKIATAAETYYVYVAPHNSNGPISTVASLHLDTCIPNCFMQEIFVSFVQRYNELLTNPLVIENGYARPPEGPGWGTDIDEDAIRRYPPVDYRPIESEPYNAY
jgi:galactonate dehydratase